MTTTLNFDNFDATDPKHQVGPEHKPDKADTWKIPPEQDQWVLVHNAFRAEVEAMKKALAAVSERIGKEEPPQWTVQSIQKWWELHSAIRKDHCKSEGEYWLKPMFVERFKYPEGLDEEHDALEAKSNEVDDAVSGLSDGKTKLTDIIDAWSAYEAVLIPHLQHEEQTIFALRRVYFTQEESVAEDREIIYEAPEEAMGALIYHMGQDKFRSQFMKSRGIPFFVWHAAFKGRLSTYSKNMVVHLDALVDGKAPEQAKKKGWFS